MSTIEAKLNKKPKQFENAQFSPAYDAFGRSRVSEPYTLFDGKEAAYQNKFIYQPKVTGSGAGEYQPGFSWYRMAVTEAAGRSAIQSTRYLEYAPGKSHLILATGVWQQEAVGIKRRTGYFDDENGIFLEQDENGLSFVVRSTINSVLAENRARQADWNLDSLNGDRDRSTTDFLLNCCNGFILIIDIEWLGLGRVRCGFVIDGLTIWAHEFCHANNKPTVYMLTACLPVRHEIISDGTATAGTYYQYSICNSVSSEGGVGPKRQTRTASRAALSIGAATRTGAIAIRLNTANKRKAIQIISAHCLITSSVDRGILEIYLGGSVSGGSWAAADALSIAEVNNTLTGFSLTGASLLWSQPISTDQKAATIPEADLEPATSDFDGTQFLYLICINPLSGALTADVVLNWRELF